MALIHCPECGNPVSDKAAACPKCGHPVEGGKPEPIMSSSNTPESDNKSAQASLVTKPRAKAWPIVLVSLITIGFLSSVQPGLGPLIIIAFLLAWCGFLAYKAIRNGKGIGWVLFAGFITWIASVSALSISGNGSPSAFPKSIIPSLIVGIFFVTYLFHVNTQKLINASLNIQKHLLARIVSGCFLGLSIISLAISIEGANFEKRMANNDKKTNDLISSSRDAMLSKDYRKGLELIDEAKKSGYGNQDQVKAISLSYLQATQPNRVSKALAILTEAEFAAYQANKRLPQKKYFDNPDLNSAFIAYASDGIPDAEKLRREGVAQARKEAELKKKRDREQRIAREKQEREAEKARKLASLLGKKPENSAWDGSVHTVKRYLKDNLKDPDSVQYIEWSPVSMLEHKGENYWAVRVKYRAKNSFGGYVVSNQMALIRHDIVFMMLDL